MAQDKDIANSSATTIALMERFEIVDEPARADKAKAIQTAARNSYRLPVTVNNSVNQAMAVSIDARRTLEVI